MRQTSAWWAVVAATVLVAGACATGASTAPAQSLAAKATSAPVRSATPLNRDASGLSLSGIDSETAAGYVEIAARDPWVVDTIGPDRADPVEVVDYGDGKSGIAVLIYDYTASKALRVTFDSTRIEIVQRTESSEQPGFSPREIARAEELAAASDMVTKNSAGILYRVWNVTGAHTAAFDGHRVLAVFLAPEATSADHLLIAFADLSVDAVVKVEDDASY